MQNTIFQLNIIFLEFQVSQAQFYMHTFPFPICFKSEKLGLGFS